MSKREYLQLAMTMAREFLHDCIKHPSNYMRPIHVEFMLHCSESRCAN
jgi:hypothetical protein